MRISKLVRCHFLVFLVSMQVCTHAQNELVFTHADTLRGMLSAERSCYKTVYYDLHLSIHANSKFLEGYNVITFKAVRDFSTMQIDLFNNLSIYEIMHNGEKLDFWKDSNSVFIYFVKPLKKGVTDSIQIVYSGHPHVAKAPPWDGGFIWTADTTGVSWISVACEGKGASLWWPCKDHLSDKPDSMKMTFDVPDYLTCASNGLLRYVKKLGMHFTRYCWFVSYPVINYDITLNLANFSHFHDFYFNGNDTLALDYYVLKYNESKAKEQFKQVKTMLQCYEKRFGKYPFYRDGYKLIETPYWGMEHQSAISYGNNYSNNNFGFDYIIIHESAHEWWGNSVSCTDLADLWIHESFATYAEALYVECISDHNNYIKYLLSQRPRIRNEHPIIGPYNVNYQGTIYDDDMYYKGSWTLHTFRNVLNNDSLFFGILRGLQSHFRYGSVNTDSIISFICRYTGHNYFPFFRQYLMHPSPPVFDYKIINRKDTSFLQYRWLTDRKDFSMPVKIFMAAADSGARGSPLMLTPATGWQVIQINSKNINVDEDDYYVNVKKEE